MKSSALKYIFYYSLLIINYSFINGCFNPFAPKIDTSPSAENIITDQKTIEGAFQNFKYSYTFKDTSIYGQLLNDDFIFTYFDYDLGVEVSWDRTTDMKTTHGLFTNTQDLLLIWNNIVFQEGDSLMMDVKRSFNLTITFNPNDIINFYGFVDMTFIRPTASDKWKLKRWKDLTNP
ncbi:MAG: hypothetical protein ACRDFC_08800 [Ignavibacteria bacterium]